MAVKYKTIKQPAIKQLPTPSSNGRPENVESKMFSELGTPGLDAWYGFVYKAYNADLYGRGVYEPYNRMRRSDPEVTIVRQIFGTVASGVRIEPDLPEKPSDDDKRFQEFYVQTLDDIEGGIDRWRDTFVAYVPFMGWAWWEAVPAVRKRDWIPPDDDLWRSKYDDGLLGFRRSKRCGGSSESSTGWRLCKALASSTRLDISASPKLRRVS